MIIEFDNSTIRKTCSSVANAVKAHGKIRADKLLLRLAQIKAANTEDEFKYLPGRFHQLKGSRIGQWSCSLDGNWRLIFRVELRDDGSYAVIIEVIDYH